MERRSNFGSYPGNHAETLTKARLADLVYHFVDDLSRLAIYVGAGPED